MSEAHHRKICFKLHGVTPELFLQHAAAFEAVRAEVKCTLCFSQDRSTACVCAPNSLTCNLCHNRKKQCDFFTLLRYRAYASLEGITVSEAATRLRGAPKVLAFPSELYRRLLEALEARNSRLSELVRIDEERERVFPEVDEDRARFKEYVEKDRAEDPWRGVSGSGKEKKREKKAKKSKINDKDQRARKEKESNSSSSLRVFIPAIPKTLPSVPPRPATPPPPPKVAQPPRPVNSLLPPPADVANVGTKRPVPLDSSEPSRNVRPRLDLPIPPPDNLPRVNMNRLLPPIPVPSHDLISQFRSRGFDMEQQTFLKKFVEDHQVTLRELQDERRRSAQYRAERNRLQDELVAASSRSDGFAAEVYVERNRVELLTSQMKAVEASSAALRKEFIKSRERTKELEQQLAQRSHEEEVSEDTDDLHEVSFLFLLRCHSHRLTE
jgi:hypothetical protein